MPAASKRPIGLLYTIRAKILLAFVAISVITGCLGGYAVHGIRQAGVLVVETFDQSLMSINYARAAATDFAQMQAAFARRRDATDPTARQQLDAQITTAADSLDEDLGIAADRSRSQQASNAAQAVKRAAADWRVAEQREDTAALDAASTAVDAQIDLLINFTAGDGFQYRQRALGQIATDTRLNIAGTIAALVIAAGITWLLSRRIMGPVAAASAAAARIARGELDTAIPPGGADELGALLDAMVVMRDNIRSMMDREIAQRRSAQSRLLDAIECSSEGVLLVDSEGMVVIANSQIATFFQPVADYLKPGTPFATLLAATVDQGCFVTPSHTQAQMTAWLEDRAPSATDQLLADGRWLRISRSTTLESGIVLICSDITASKEHAAALEKTNLWFSTTLDNMSQGLVMFDGENRLQVVNRSFAEIHGLALSDLPGITYGRLLDLNVARGHVPAERRDAQYHERMVVVAQGKSRMLVQDLADGRQLSIMHEPMPDGGWVATYEDVTERRRADAQILFLTRHDALTGLPNRVQLTDRVQQALEQRQNQPDRDRACALLCLDLDQFKAVNDALGQHIGDLLLCGVAERLRSCVGEEDVVARLGGDEFAILLLSLGGPNELVVTAQRILAALRMPYDIEGERVICGTSIGIALAPSDGDTCEALMRNADTALFRAKSDGRGLYRFFEMAMDARQQARRSLELDLRRAMETEGFTLFFQPLVETKREAICGFESLLRWQHPTRGMVSPAEFVPMAEECGLIIPLGEWVLREACRVAATWPDHVKVAVNVSPLQFKSPNLVDAVIDALARSGLPAQRLELEITESVLLHDSDAVMATLHRLHALGLRISMDDFGTGYSSLSYLRSFPFDKIKIDQSFVRDLGGAKDTRAIIRAIIGMGLSLGMRITAEGVETETQLAILRAEGCTEIQGYYYSRPKPAAEVPALLERLSGASELLQLVS